jgi:protein-S-isoprenylcysteine O-methyltransferase Ste14
MGALSAVLQSKRTDFFSTVGLAVIWGLFAVAHWNMFQKTHDLGLLLVVVSEALAAGFFIFRTDPKSVSVIPFDWLVALGGTFTPLFFRPSESGVLPIATYLIMAGTLLQIVSLISLNRSFALVAAKREIKTGFMYRIVRHPIYASYCLIFGGYILTNTTLENLLVYVVLIGFLCIRIFREEQHLALDPMYREYMSTVRYRLVPFIF